MSQALHLGGLTEQGILVELQLPLTSRRLDCLVKGRDVEWHAIERLGRG